MQNNGFVRQLMNCCAQAEESTVAFSLYDGNRVIDITYRYFLEDVRKAAGYFIHGNIHAQHIAIAAQNSYDYLVVFFGITGSGNVAVLLNQDLPGEVLRQQCNQADVSIVCGNAPCISEPGKNGNADFLNFETILAGQTVPVDAFPRRSTEEPITMMFTSGTTGQSKIAVFSESNLQSTIENMKEISTDPGSCRMLLTFPLYHISGVVTVALELQLHNVVCIGREPRYILADIPKLNPTYIAMVPSILSSIVKLLKAAEKDEQRCNIIGSKLNRMLVSGASAVNSLCLYMMDMGISVETAYGMTESMGSGTSCVWNEDNIGSIGKPYGSIQCRIEDGELLLKGPSIMKGYYKDPEATAAIIQDGWLHTGDLARCDEKGYYYLTGRKKNVIILANGENVNPEEIEAKLGECAEILEVLVYGDGKKICADIYTNNAGAAEAYVSEYNEKVPLYRQVREVNCTSTPLEKTGSGKIKRKEKAYV